MIVNALFMALVVSRNQLSGLSSVDLGPTPVHANCNGGHEYGIEKIDGKVVSL